jgi:DNA-binding PadR family transcriptional regulator
MTSIRLYILGALSRNGPMHGHQIRRLARIDRTELWTDVKPGSLYAALHRLEAEGAIKAVSTSRDGNLPTRVVYDLTDDGRSELVAYRDEAMRDTRLRPDPVDLALQSISDMSDDQLMAAIEDRRRLLVSQLENWHHLFESAQPHLRDLEGMTFRHSLARLTAEIAWHDELLAMLPQYLREHRAQR